MKVTAPNALYPLSVEAFVDELLREGLHEFDAGDVIPLAQNCALAPTAVVTELRSYGLRMVGAKAKSPAGRGFTANDHNRWG